MKCNDAFSRLLDGSFDFNRPAKELKIDLIEISSHINHLYNSDVDGFQKALLDKVTSVSKEVNRIKGEGNITQLLINLTHLNSILAVDSEELFENSISVFSSDEKKHFPLAEQENIVTEAVGFLMNNNALLPVIDKVFKGKVDGIKENTFAIDGPAGSGKTQFIVKNALRIFAKTSKTKPKVMTIAEDPVKASDLFKEVKGDANILSVGEKGFTTKEAKYDKESVSKADIIVIDEASLMTEEDFYVIAKNKKKDAKIIMLFDSDQVSTEMFRGKSNASNEATFKSRKLKTRFRTTSKLNINAFNAILSEGKLLTEEPFITAFAKANNSNTDLLIGVNSTSNNDKITDNDKRIDAILEAFNQDVGDISLLENIKKQAENSKKKFTLFISTDVPNADAIIRKKMPDLFDSIKNPGLETKVLNTQSIQGSEADYVIVDLPHLDTIKGQMKQNDFLKRITNMLLSRSRFYTHIVNTAGYNMRSEKALDKTFSYLTTDKIELRAKNARGVYEDIYETLSGQKLDPESKITLAEELESITESNQFVKFLKDYDRVDLKNPPEEFHIELINKAKELGLLQNKPEDQMNINDIQNQLNMMNSFVDSLGGRYNDVFNDYISKLEVLLGLKKQNLENIHIATLTRISESLDESTSKLSDELISIIESSKEGVLTNEKLERFEELQTVISARDALSQITGPKKQSLDLMNQQVNDMISQSGLTDEQGVVKFFQDNGFAYLYEDTMKSSLGEDEFAKRNLGSDITNEELIELVSEYKKAFYRMGTKHTSDSLENSDAFEILFIKDKGKIRTILLDNKTKTILSQLNLDNELSQDFFNKIDGFIGKEESKSISIDKKNIMKTAGPIVQTPAFLPISNLLTNLDSIDGLQYSQPLTIRDIGIEGMAGNTVVFYSYSNNTINFASEDFKAWSKENLPSFLAGNYKGLYIDNNGIKHSIGYIPLNHKRFSFSRMNTIYMDGIGEANKAGRNVKDIGEINSSFENSKRLVELFSVINSAVSDDSSLSLDKLTEDIAKGNRGAQLFGVSKENNSAPDLVVEANNKAKESILDLFNGLSEAARVSVKDIISFISEKTGVIRTDDLGNIITKDVPFIKDGEETIIKSPEKIFGSVLTFIPKGEANGVEYDEFSHFDIVALLKVVNANTNGESAEVLNFFDSIIGLKSNEENIFGFFGASGESGIKVNPQLDRTKGNVHITLLPNKSDSQLSMDEIFEVNIASVDKPRIIVNFNQAIEDNLTSQQNATETKPYEFEEYEGEDFDSDEKIEKEQDTEQENQENNTTFVESDGVKIPVNNPDINTIEDLIGIIETIGFNKVDKFASMSIEQKTEIIRALATGNEVSGSSKKILGFMKKEPNIVSLFKIC